jgi:hypothetical protein
MAAPSKEYRAWIRVKPTDELLPSLVLAQQELETRLDEALEVGRPVARGW